MIARHGYLLSAGLMLAACAGPAAERVRIGDALLADSDRQLVRPGQSVAMPLSEAPLFQTDPKGPPAAMTADSDRQLVPSGQAAAIHVTETPLFRIDPKGSPAAMTADTERRSPVPPAPGPMTEEPRPR